MNVISRGVRNAFRNGIRSFSIIIILGLSIGLALTMFIAYQAVNQKITSVKSSVGNTVSISPAGVRGFEGGGTALTDAQLSKIAALTNVVGVSKSLSDRLTTSDTNVQSAVEAGNLGQRFSENNGTAFGGGDMPRPAQTTRTFTPTVTVIGTTTPTTASTTEGGGTLTVTSGQVFSGTSSEDVALIGTSLATKNNLKVGSTFTAYGKDITVVGIFDAGNTFSNNQIIMPLKTVQTLSDQAGAITGAVVTVNSIDNVASVTAAAKTALGDAADVTNDSIRAADSVAPLENIKTISLYSLIGAVAAGAIIILLTMIMIVRERRREIGVIKAIGASNAKVVMQFMTEALTLTVLGSIIGMIIGTVAGNPITKLLVKNASSSATGTGAGMRRGFGALTRNIDTVHAAVGWPIVLEGLGAALVIAVLGSAIAAFFIAKVRPSEVLRSE